MNIEIEIKGNKYCEQEIDRMLIDYINIGENVYKRRNNVVEHLIDNFIAKYKKDGKEIVNKEKNIKRFKNSAKSMYKLAEFYLYDSKFYDKYVYMISRDYKGSKVYLHIKEDKEIIFIYNSLQVFFENWFIYKRIGVMNYDR